MDHDGLVLAVGEERTLGPKAQVNSPRTRPWPGTVDGWEATGSAVQLTVLPDGRCQVRGVRIGTSVLSCSGTDAQGNSWLGQELVAVVSNEIAVPTPEVRGLVIEEAF